MIVRVGRASWVWRAGWLPAMVVVGIWAASTAARAQAPASPAKPLAADERKVLLAQRDRLDQESRQLRAAGKLPEAIAAAAKMLALERQIFGNEHEDVASSLQFLAECHEQAGEFSLAETRLREMLDIRRKAYGEQNWRTVDARSGLEYAQRLATLPAEVRANLEQAVRLLDQTGPLTRNAKYAQALPLAQRAAQLRRSALGENDRRYADSLSALGFIYHAQQDDARALPIFAQALAIDERILGPAHPDTARCLGNLATAYRGQGNDARALPLYQRAVAINEQALGADHADLAISLSNLAMVYKDQGSLDQAVPLLERALATKQKVMGPENPGLANTLDNLAAVYHDQGDYARALPLYQRALAIREKNFGEIHPATAGSLNNLAALHRAMGNPAQVLPLAQRVLKIYETVFGVGHPATTVSLLNLGLAYQAQEDFAHALPLFERVRAIQEKTWGVGHVKTSASLGALGGLYQDQGKYVAALPLFEQALAIREKDLGPERPETVASVLSLAALYQAQGRYSDALPLFKRAVEIRKKTLGKNHPQTAEAMSMLGSLDQDRGDYASALPLFEQALAIDERALGPDHSSIGSIANSLAMLYETEGNYAKALPLFQRARSIAEKSFGANHPNTAVALGNLGALYQVQGDYTQALALFRQALAIKQQALGAEHPDTANSINLLASLYKDRGNYAEALRLNRRVLAIRERALAADHPKTAETLNQLASLYESSGDDVQALPLLQRALAIREKTLGPDHPDTATSLNNLAEFLRAHDDYARALPLYQRALAIDEKAFGTDHHKVAIDLNNLALLYSSQGDYAQALTLQQRALAIDEKAYGPDHPATALTLRNMAGLRQDQGDFDQALALYQRALAIRQKSLGADHPGTAELLTSLAFLYQFHGDARQALPLHQRALAISRQDLDLTADVQSERQQLAMVENMRYELDGLLTLVVDQQGRPDDAYREVLAWKGAVLARQRATRLARRSASPQLRRAFDELQSVSTQLAKLALAEPEARQLSDWQAKIAGLSGAKERLETELSDQSVEFRRAQSQRQRGVADVRRALPSDCALVDFLIYRHFELGPGGKGKLRPMHHVAAFVVRGDQPVVLLDLGPVEPIATAIDAWRTTYGQVRNSATDPGADLRRRVWEKFEPHLHAPRTVLLSPDAALARFPWAALPGKRLQTYLCEEYALAVVPVAQLLPDLLEAPDAEQPGHARPEASLLLVGEVEYGAAPGQSADWLASRAAVGVENGGQRMVFGPLANTRDEIATIRDSFANRYPAATVLVLTKAQATESAFERSAPHMRWLHLATHGFFAPPDKRSALSLAAPRDTASEAARSAQQMAIGNEPGLLSGLAFAGANATAHENEDDGILTATEVATLDLSHVEVAVLSACQTGLGKVAGGEGVLGLQRAFQLGGARTTVTSLWTVSDLGTRVLMQHFYENLWTRGMSKVEALRQAQIEMLKTPLGKLADSSGRGLELNVDQPLIDQRLPPFYWAAFVLSGDWRWQLARPIVRSAVKIAAVAAVYTAACFCGIVRDSLGRGGVRRGGHFPAFVLRAPVTSTNACRERAVARDSRQLHWAELSMQEDLDEVDAAGDDTLNRILWFAARRRDDSNSDWTVSSSEIATDD